MIVVVEGPSAAGKTTWLARWNPALVVAETGRIEPPRLSDRGDAQFWADVNADRWNLAVSVEAAHGVALCDTDPLKLHYDYCRARAGVGPWTMFDAGVRACAAAITQRRLGIADMILCETPDVETLDARRRGDSTRTRRNFDLHRDFGPALRDWYRTLDELDPGRVAWAFPDTIPRVEARERYDTGLFEHWMTTLPRHSPPPEISIR